MRAIVTGANSFVGSALLKQLVEHGNEVVAVIHSERSSVERIKDLPHVEIVYCDMDRLEALPEKIREGAEVFYHLAWVGSFGPLRSDYAAQLTNARWAVDAVKAAHEIGCKRYVGIGALAELDAGAYTPLDGSTPNMVSCYAAGKMAAYYMSKAMCSSLGMEHLWARLSNTYGPGNYTSNFVNFASKTMLSGKPANFTSGEQMYDFVYIEDTAQGIWRIGAYGKPNCSYYIGSTRPAKLKQFIQMIRDEIDPAIQLHLGAVPFNGVEQPESVYDCTKLIRDTGYSPKFIFQEGIKTTVKWLREQMQEE